jgi:hypothetical protein
MATFWEFYHTTFRPTGLTTTVGGAITSAQLAGDLNELFAYVDGPPSGSETAEYQYRKIHVKNASTVQLTGVRAWIDAVEHSEQIAIGIESGNASTSTNGTTAPTDPSIEFLQPNAYSTGLNIDTLPASQSTGIWIRQTLSGIDEPDPYATLRVNVGGIK